MSTLAEALTLAHSRSDYDALLRVLPYAHMLGLRALLQGEVVRVWLPFRHGLLGNPLLPAIHGGVVGAVLESAALLQVIHARKAPHVPKTIDFTVDYLRASRAKDLYAEAEVQRMGRRIVNVRMRAFQDRESEPVALGRGNFLVD